MRDGRLPAHVSPAHAIAGALPALAPPARVSVSQAAERHRRLSTAAYRGAWRNEVAPYMVEPMDMITSRRFTAAVFVGPARSSKTDSLILNAILHGAICNPRHMLVVHINKDAARDFSLEKITPMIEACPDLRKRLATERGGDNLFDKRFMGGMRLSIGWPVVGKLSARDLPFVAFTDYDRMDDDIGEEGQPFALGRKRTQTFGSLGMTVVESSPGRPVLDEEWRPHTPHEAPPTTGALSLYNRGTRGRLYWRCPQCEQEFEPTFDRLQWPQGCSPAEAAAAVTMTCPHGGCVITQEQRNDLNKSARWLHETDAGELVPISDDRVRSTDVVTWWLPGPAASFQNWREMVLRYLEAVAEFDKTGDEAALKATVNLDQGRPYLPRSRGETGTLSEAKLRARAERFPVGVAPAETRFITIQVDTQASRFVVHVDAWGEGLERWLVDRFELHQPPAGAPNCETRAIDPARYAEDWGVLFALKDRVIPVDGSGLGLRPLVISIDSAGAPGVTDRAYAFWRSARAAGLGNRFRLVKGVGGLNKRRAVQAFPETVHGQNKRAATDIPIVMVATDRLKDEISAALTRDEPGPGAYHLPEGIDAAVFSELSAERREAKGWQRKAGGRRNEALDLAVYGKAIAIVLQAEKINWTDPPAWALPVASNSMVATLADGTRAVEQPAPAAAAAAATPRATPASVPNERTSGWWNR